MTIAQAIRILQGAAAEAESHRKMAVGAGDIHKNNKFSSIRMGFTDSIDVLRAHRAAGRVKFDKRLIQFGGMR